MLKMMSKCQPDQERLNLSSLICQLVEDDCFIKRPLSWVASTDKYFFKIPRKSDSLQYDFKAIESAEISRKEYQVNRILCCIDSAVSEPIALINSCLVMPYIEGVDLRVELKASRNANHIQSALEDGMVLCARIHRNSDSEHSDIPIHNYRNDPFFPASEAVLGRLESHARAVVIRGFEVRNLMRDTGDQQLRFFDPHDIVVGVPEEDVTRYLLSVLMLNWQRGVNCLIWSKFDWRQLREAYENERGTRLSADIVSYALSLNIAMRQHHAIRAANTLSKLKRLAAHAYWRCYFKQIHLWRKRNGI